VRYFTCKRCGARGEVAFRAKGDSGWQTGSIMLEVDPQDVHTAAEEDLMSDAERVLGLVKCPTCKQRAPGSVRWAWIRILAWFAAGGLGYAAMGVIIHVQIGAIVCGVLGCWQAWREHSRFRRADRAKLLRLKPGTRPAPEAGPTPKPVLPPAPKLPPARAITAPPIQPIQPRGPDEEPAFLRTSDE